MINKDDILRDREKRLFNIKERLEQYDVICVKANIMGENKNTYFSSIVIDYYEVIIEKIVSYITKEHFNSFDGSYILYCIPKGNNLKKQMIELEEKEPFGRLVDIDVYQSTISENRSKPRKCLLCEENALVCARNRIHSTEELIKKEEEIVYQKLKSVIFDLIKECMMIELDLSPKFGLVSKDNNGSHKDMDYQIMQKAQDAIIPYFLMMFHEGYTQNNLDIVFRNIKNIGLLSEKRMLEVTNNVNSYKGLIFCLGLFVSSIAYFFKNKQKYNDIYLNIKYMTRDIFKDIINYKEFGVKAYEMYHITGARGEAYNGYETIYNAVNLINNYTRTDLYQLLIYFIRNCDDTVLLKRSKNYQNYLKNKEYLSSVNYQDEESIKKATTYCIDNNLSIGGCADLLVVSLFISKLNDIFNIKKEHKICGK